jgi:hypothetical protein
VVFLGKTRTNMSAVLAGIGMFHRPAGFVDGEIDVIAEERQFVDETPEAGLLEISAVMSPAPYPQIGKAVLGKVLAERSGGSLEPEIAFAGDRFPVPYTVVGIAAGGAAIDTAPEVPLADISGAVAVRLEYVAEGGDVVRKYNIIMDDPVVVRAPSGEK